MSKKRKRWNSSSSFSFVGVSMEDTEKSTKCSNQNQIPWKAHKASFHFCKPSVDIISLPLTENVILW